MHPPEPIPLPLVPFHNKLAALPSPALHPDVLAELTKQSVEELIAEGSSHNTLASYRTALRYWAAWYGLRYGMSIALPVPATVVVQFMVDHAERMTERGLQHDLPEATDRALVAGGYKAKPGALALSTLLHRISVLSKAHIQRELTNPAHEPMVRELIARTRRAYARRGDLPQKKAALTKDPLEALLDTCDDSLRGQRDRALLLFAWSSGGRRRSEVTSADMRFLRRVGAQEYTYELAHSKTNQTGTSRQSNVKPLVGPAGEALARWLDSAHIKEGKIFRRIRKGGQVAEPLTPAAVTNIVKERCALAGIQGDFSAHSLRSGFVTEAGRQGVSLGETMDMTGHRSVAVVLGYFRAEADLNRKSANLLHGGRTES